MMSLVSQLGEDYARRIGGWSSKACEFYLRVMDENVCAGDLDGVPAAVLARSLPFGPQREFEKMLKNSGDRLAFQRRYNQEQLAPGIPQEHREQLFVDAMNSAGVFESETFSFGRRTIGRADNDTMDESGTSDHDDFKCLAEESVRVGKETIPSRDPFEQFSIEDVDRMSLGIW